jgi:hypothetical protein
LSWRSTGLHAAKADNESAEAVMEDFSRSRDKKDQSIAQPSARLAGNGLFSLEAPDLNNPE